MADCLKLCTTEWWDKLGGMLNANPKFKHDGKNFTIELIFKCGEDDDSRWNKLTFNEGVFLWVKPATAKDEADTEFVITAEPDIWEGVHKGTISARLGLLKGDLELQKGSMAKMLRFLGAAGLIFDTLKLVPTIYDNGSTSI